LSPKFARTIAANAFANFGLKAALEP